MVDKCKRKDESPKSKSIKQNYKIRSKMYLRNFRIELIGWRNNRESDDSILSRIRISSFFVNGTGAW